MAHTSTARRRFGTALSTLGVGALAAAMLVGLAGTASAHNNRTKADCRDGVTTLTVDLRAYNGKDANSVKVSDGDKLLAQEADFGTDYKKKWELDATVDHVFTVGVKAWDDPSGKQGFSFTDTLKVSACVEVPPTTTTPPTSSEEVPPPVTTEVPTSSTPVPQAEAPLAETGASIALPLGIAAVLLVGGGVLLFVVRRRNRA